MCSFCFTRFPLRSEESFIICSLAKLKQETHTRNSGVREERSRSLKKKITEVNHDPPRRSPWEIC